MGLAWSWGCKRELGSPCELGGSSQLTFRLVKYSILDTVYTQEFLGVGVLRKRVFTLLRVGMLPRLCGHKDVQRLCAKGSGSGREVDTFQRRRRWWEEEPEGHGENCSRNQPEDTGKGGARLEAVGWLKSQVKSWRGPMAVTVAGGQRRGI